jgi:hypothetical protein
VIVIVLLFGFAFGIGSNAFVGNTIASKQAKSHFRFNEHLKIAGVEGTLINITSTMLRLKLMKGECIFPRNGAEY